MPFWKRPFYTIKGPRVYNNLHTGVTPEYLTLQKRGFWDDLKNGGEGGNRDIWVLILWTLLRQLYRLPTVGGLYNPRHFNPDSTTSVAESYDTKVRIISCLDSTMPIFLHNCQISHYSLLLQSWFYDELSNIKIEFRPILYQCTYFSKFLYSNFDFFIYIEKYLNFNDELSKIYI